MATEKDPFDFQPHKPNRGVKFLLFLLLGSVFLFFFYTAVLRFTTHPIPDPAVRPSYAPLPTAELQTTPAVSDYVANQERRLELENEQARIELELTEMARQIEQADQQQQLALLRRQQELEIERGELQLTADAWAETQRQKAEELELTNRAEAEAVAIRATEQAHQITLDKERAEAQREQALSRLVESLVPLAYVLGIGLAVIVLGVVAYTAFVVGLIIHARTLPLREVTPPPAPAGAEPTPAATMSIEELMAIDEFFRRATQPPTPPRPTQPPVRDRNYGSSNGNYGNYAVITGTPEVEETGVNREVGREGAEVGEGSVGVRVINQELMSFIPAEYRELVPLSNRDPVPAWAGEAIKKMDTAGVSRSEIAAFFYRSPGRNWRKIVEVLGNERITREG